MRYSLKLHPATPCEAVSRIEVEVSWPEPGALGLRYMATGRIADVRVPSQRASSRADELWRHTCFEAFLRGAGEGYAEFNFSPSTQWAAYGFTRYRTGMKPLDVVTPRLETNASPDALTVRASFDIGALDMQRLGLTAVIEETNGRISYWSLAHAAGKPDFHHSDGFLVDLAQALRS